MNEQTKDKLFLWCLHASAYTCLMLLLGLIIVIVVNGLPALSVSFLLAPASQFGSEGGIFYQIIGSLLLVTTVALISLPLSLGVALFQSEYLKNGYWRKLSQTMIYSLNGIPSIIFGLFGLILFTNLFNLGLSWMVGAIILSLMILPTVVLATYQAINSIPIIYRENAQALGLNHWQVIIRVILPQGFSGAITGLLLGLARAIGETAPIMFIATAFSGAGIPGSLLEPVSTLPTHILALAKQATDTKALTNAWGASLILLIIVMILAVIALLTRRKNTLFSER